MKTKNKVILIVVVFLVVFSVIYFMDFYTSKTEEAANVVSEAEEVKQEQPAPIRYFSEGSDKITISVSENVLYTDAPTTILNYYALDNSNQLVHFKGGDRAFVRILGILHLFTENVEIFHPKKPDGSIDDTIFSGNISITEPGKYLIKVCLGKSINLDSEGNMIWPFGCFEDSTSEVIDVYVR